MYSPPLHHPVPTHPIALKSNDNNNNNNNPTHSYIGNSSYIPQEQHQRYSQYAPQQQQLQQHQQHHQQYNTNNGPSQGGNFNPNQFGSFFQDPTTRMGLTMGKSAMAAGQSYMQQNFSSYFVSTSALRHYFQVSNSYVIRKLGLVLFPWRHKPWTRQYTVPRDISSPCDENEILSSNNSYSGYPGSNDINQNSINNSTNNNNNNNNNNIKSHSGSAYGYKTPREDLNSPDMYIPLMAFTTYILLTSVLAGVSGKFSPEILGYTATASFAVLFVEIIFLKLGCYLLNIVSESQILDLVAYSGYKFIGVIITTIFASFFNSKVFTSLIFIYTFVANAFFLLRSLKYVVLPDVAPGVAAVTVSHSQRQRRVQFLFIYSFILQLVFMAFLCI